MSNELPKLEVVETPKFDTSAYIGKQSKIAKLTIEPGKFGSFLKVESEKLGENEDGKPVKASMLFGLKGSDEGLVISEQGELAKFMKNKKVEDYRKLMGVPITILSEADDKGNDWLVFA